MGPVEDSAWLASLPVTITWSLRIGRSVQIQDNAWLGARTLVDRLVVGVILALYITYLLALLLFAACTIYHYAANGKGHIYRRLIVGLAYAFAIFGCAVRIPVCAMLMRGSLSPDDPATAADYWKVDMLAHAAVACYTRCVVRELQKVGGGMRACGYRVNI